jgi:polygalacturonase
MIRFCITYRDLVMRRIAYWLGLFLAFCVFVAQVIAAFDTATGWDAVAVMLTRINAPQFPDHDFSITDFGARGDGQTNCKPAFDQAIQACHEASGGRVVVPAGQWLVRGPIHLKSGVNLHVEKGAVIRFSTEPDDYMPPVLTRFEGNELMNFSPLIYALDQENIAITGGGTLDGQAGRDKWWPWKGKTGSGPNQSADSQTLRDMGEKNVPAAKRVFGKGHYLRPNFVQPYRCKNVLIEGVTFTNSPMWVLHPVLCENVTIRGVTVESHGPNSDGCDPESCRDVLIEDCTFNTGDDCIAIKSGRNADGRRIAQPSENIIIRGCTMKDGHGGVVLGSEMSGGIRNVFVENCTMDSPNLDRAIRLKSNSLRGGFLENLFVRNVRVGQVKEAVVRINLMYDKDRGEHYPKVRNVFIENVTSEKSGRPFYFVGLEQAPIDNVVISNCTFKNAGEPSVFENVDEVFMRNVRLLPSDGLDDE